MAAADSLRGHAPPTPAARVPRSLRSAGDLRAASGRGSAAGLLEHDRWRGLWGSDGLPAHGIDLDPAPPRLLWPGRQSAVRREFVAGRRGYAAPASSW